jgi:hypothetical protein
VPVAAMGWARGSENAGGQVFAGNSGCVGGVKANDKGLEEMRIYKCSKTLKLVGL